MPLPPQFWRFGLFCVACTALLAAAIGFGGSEQPPPPLSPSFGPEVISAAPIVSQSATAGGVASLRVRLRAAAHHFLSAFFHYEVGELGPRVRRELRAYTTSGFATELLRAPPRRPPSSPPPALPGRLTLAAVSVAPPRVLVSGSAHRGSEAEDFSFVFEAVDGAWLASGPGE